MGKRKRRARGLSRTNNAPSTLFRGDARFSGSKENPTLSSDFFGDLGRHWRNPVSRCEGYAHFEAEVLGILGAAPQGGDNHPVNKNNSKQIVRERKELLIRFQR